MALQHRQGADVKKARLTGWRYLGGASAGCDCHQVQPAHKAGHLKQMQILATPNGVGRYWGERVGSALGQP